MADKPAAGAPRRGWLPAEWLGLPSFTWSLTLVGLCVYTFVIVSYYVPGAEVGIAIAAAGLLLGGGKLRVPFPVVIYAAFTAWGLVAALTSSYPDIAFEKVVDNAKLLVIMLVVVNAFQSEGQLRFYLLFLLGCYILFPVRGTLVGDDNLAGRVVWNYIYSNPNDLATLCLIALGLALGFIFAVPSRRIVRLGAMVSAALLFVVILLTQSRGAFIGMVVGMGPGLLLWGAKRPVRLALASGLAVALIAFAVPPEVWQRIAGIGELTDTSTIAQADAEGSAAERYEIQLTALRIFMDHPLVGVGLGTYPLANRAYAPQIGAMDTHNTYLNLAAEVGFPGLALWCALVGSVLTYARRSRKRAPPGALATQQLWMERALYAYLVAGLFGSYAKLAFPYLLLGVIWSSATLLNATSPHPGGDAPRNGT